MFRSSSPGIRGYASLVVMLLLALLVAGVLAYQAQDAARSQRDIAEQTLTEYAAFASERFGDRAGMTLTALQMLSLQLPVSLEDASPDVELPSVEAYRTNALEQAAWCGCLDDSAVFFRLDRRNAALTTAGSGGLSVGPWIEQIVAGQSEPAPEQFAFGEAPLREGRNVPYAFQSRRSDVVMGTVEGASRTLVYYQVHSSDGSPVAIYGYEAGTAALVAPVFRRILSTTHLLPRPLIGEMPNDSALTIVVTDTAANQAFRSNEAALSPYTTADTLPDPWDGLIVRASLRPGMAGELVIGGLPHSRLPLLLALLGLTAALMVGALVQLHRHQELVRARANFVAGVSHELRTPLTQIRLYADLLRTGRLSAENQERSARVIEQEARRLSHLVENVLRFSSSRNGAARPAVEPRALAPLTREIMEDFAPLASARGAELVAELDESVTALVEPDAFRQIVLNLLDNAVKYGPAGQRIRVRLEEVEGAARVAVDDQGEGVPAHDRERIWEPYTRLDRAVDSGMGGSGIGLSVVRELVERQGGRVAVTDAEGGGARFAVELPAAPSGSEAA